MYLYYWRWVETVRCRALYEKTNHHFCKWFQLRIFVSSKFLKSESVVSSFWLIDRALARMIPSIKLNFDILFFRASYLICDPSVQIFSLSGIIFKIRLRCVIRSWAFILFFRHQSEISPIWIIDSMFGFFQTFYKFLSIITNNTFNRWNIKWIKILLEQ